MGLLYLFLFILTYVLEFKLRVDRTTLYKHLYIHTA